MRVGLRSLAESARVARGGHWQRAFHSSSRLLMAHKDYYDILGVDRSVDGKTLKKKYRELAKKYHPDSCKEEDATTKFQEINHAYDVLSDPEKRQAYDNFGPDYEQAMGGGGGGGHGGMNAADFEQFFGRFSGFGGGFGGGGAGGGAFRQGGRAMGEDIRVAVNLSFMEAVNGCQKTISYQADGKCSSCGGSGAKAGEKVNTQTCKTCQGKGFRVQYLVDGMFQIPTPCNSCNGTGKTIVNKCGTCRGSGIEKKNETTTLDIPAGVDSGMTVSHRGSGNMGPQGGSPGDLLVEIRVTPDPYFNRNGTDVHSEVSVSIAQSLLGDKIPIRTLEGEVDLTIPPGVRHGEVRRLRGKGIRDVQRQNVKGDQFITFSISMPTDLTDRQKELIAEFEKEEKEKVSKKKKKASK